MYSTEVIRMQPDASERQVIASLNSFLTSEYIPQHIAMSKTGQDEQRSPKLNTYETKSPLTYMLLA